MRTKNMLFFAPNTGAEGATALESPIAPASADSHDIATYVPPSADDIADEIMRGVEVDDDAPPIKPAAPAPKPKTPAPKIDPKPAPKPAAKEGDQKPPDTRKPEELPISELRTAYTTAKTELETLRQEVESLRTKNPEVENLRRDLEAERARLKEVDARRADQEKVLGLHSPLATQRLKDLDEKFNKEMTPLISAMPSLLPEYRSLVEAYEQLPHGRPEFEDKFAEYEQALVDKYGERKADRAIDMILRGVRHNNEIRSTQKELREQGSKFIFETELKNWSAGASEMDKDFESILDVDPEIAAADPYHPALILKHCAEQDPENFNMMKGKLELFAKRAILGPKPKTNADFPGMTEAQIAEAMQRDAQQAAKDKKMLVKLVVQGGLGQFFSRAFWRDYKKMEARLGDSVDDLPDPGDSAGKGAKPESGNVDPATYEAPEIPSEDHFSRA